MKKLRPQEDQSLWFNLKNYGKRRVKHHEHSLPYILPLPLPESAQKIGSQIKDQKKPTSSKKLRKPRSPFQYTTAKINNISYYIICHVYIYIYISYYTRTVYQKVQEARATCSSILLCYMFNAKTVELSGLIGLINANWYRFLANVLFWARKQDSMSRVFWYKWGSVQVPFGRVHTPVSSHGLVLKVYESESVACPTGTVRWMILDQSDGSPMPALKSIHVISKTKSHGVGGDCGGLEEQHFGDGDRPQQHHRRRRCQGLLRCFVQSVSCLMCTASTSTTSSSGTVFEVI